MKIVKKLPVRWLGKYVEQGYVLECRVGETVEHRITGGKMILTKTTEKGFKFFKEITSSLVPNHHLYRAMNHYDNKDTIYLKINSNLYSTLVHFCNVTDESGK